MTAATSRGTGLAVVAQRCHKLEGLSLMHTYAMQASTAGTDVTHLDPLQDSAAVPLER